MSSEAQPITPLRFAQALPSLTLSSLHTKAGELHNSIAHLQASNAQLAPFAVPPGQNVTASTAPPDVNTETNTTGTSTDLSYDQDCADAITENEEVIMQMRTRLELLKAEVEKRGAVWVWGELDDMAAGRKPGDGDVSDASGGHAGMNGHAATNGVDGDVATNGVDGSAGVNGVNGQAGTTGVHNLDGDGHAVDGNIASRRADWEATNRSGRLTDEELRRRMQQQMDELGDDEEGGMHL